MLGTTLNISHSLSNSSTTVVSVLSTLAEHFAMISTMNSNSNSNHSVPSSTSSSPLTSSTPLSPYLNIVKQHFNPQHHLNSRRLPIMMRKPQAPLCLLTASILLLFQHQMICSVSGTPLESSKPSSSPQHSEDILTNSISVVVSDDHGQIVPPFLSSRSNQNQNNNNNNNENANSANPATPVTPSVIPPNLGGQCPKWLNCTDGYFDEGKDCYDLGVTASMTSPSTTVAHRAAQRCTCIAHCCLAFDCRNWAHLVQCRRKCGAPPNRFGLRKSAPLECDKYHCEKGHFDQAWDARATQGEAQRNCVGHCCYAFDCRRALGYCRHACGVDAWVTARPLG